MKTKSFVFDGFKCTPNDTKTAVYTFDKLEQQNRILRDQKIKMNRTNPYERKSNEKPIFLVSTNQRGCIENKLRGANYHINNQRQVLIQSQKKIYQDMKVNLSNDFANKVVVPLQDSIEAKAITREYQNSRAATSQTKHRPKNVKTSDKEISVYKNSSFSKNENVLSVNSSATNLNNDSHKRSHKSNKQSTSRKGVKSAKSKNESKLYKSILY